MVVGYQAYPPGSAFLCPGKTLLHQPFRQTVSPELGLDRHRIQVILSGEGLHLRTGLKFPAPDLSYQSESLLPAFFVYVAGICHQTSGIFAVNLGYQ